jgi:hypothetical protein
VRDFKEFLKLLNSNNVEYLLIGGYAVGIYGYVRAANDPFPVISLARLRENKKARGRAKDLESGKFAALTVCQSSHRTFAPPSNSISTIFGNTSLLMISTQLIAG